MRQVLPALDIGVRNNEHSVIHDKGITEARKIDPQAEQREKKQGKVGKRPGYYMLPELSYRERNISHVFILGNRWSGAVEERVAFL